jgi:hypothetical protein
MRAGPPRSQQSGSKIFEENKRGGQALVHMLSEKFLEEVMIS